MPFSLVAQCGERPHWPGALRMDRAEGFQSRSSSAPPSRTRAGAELASSTIITSPGSFPRQRCVGFLRSECRQRSTADLLFVTASGLPRAGFSLNWDQFSSLMARERRRAAPVLVIGTCQCFTWNTACLPRRRSSVRARITAIAAAPPTVTALELKRTASGPVPGAAIPAAPQHGLQQLAQSAAGISARMKELGIRWFRVDLLREPPENWSAAGRTAMRYVEGNSVAGRRWKSGKLATQLGADGDRACSWRE